MRSLGTISMLTILALLVCLACGETVIEGRKRYSSKKKQRAEHVLGRRERPHFYFRELVHDPTDVPAATEPPLTNATTPESSSAATTPVGTTAVTTPLPPAATGTAPPPAATTAGTTPAPPAATGTAPQPAATTADTTPTPPAATGTAPAATTAGTTPAPPAATGTAPPPAATTAGTTPAPPAATGTAPPQSPPTPHDELPPGGLPDVKPVNTPGPPTKLEEDKKKFTDWKKKYGRTYATPEEDENRFNIFRANSDFIDEHNLRFANGEVGYDMATNWMAASTEAEARGFLSSVGDFADEIASAIKKFLVPNPPAVPNLPASIDWRDKGAVTAVKDQAECGACWAFSTVGSIESAYFIKTGKLLDLSAQMATTCVAAANPSSGDVCSGHDPALVYDYVIANGGLALEAGDPFLLRLWAEMSADDKKAKAACKYQSASASGTKYPVQISRYTRLPSGNEEALKAAVASQPISITIDVRSKNFFFYNSGIYNDPACCTGGGCQGPALDHAVLAVGYGTDATHGDFWLVKNSWSTGWGTDGYFKLARNDNDRCGPAAYALYPVI